MTKGWSLATCIGGTIVYGFAAIFALMAAMATVMSLAGIYDDSAMHNVILGYISMYGFLAFPVVALVSMIGAWINHVRQKYKLAGYFTLAPLVNMAVAFLALLLMFYA